MSIAFRVQGRQLTLIVLTITAASLQGICVVTGADGSGASIAADSPGSSVRVFPENQEQIDPRGGEFFESHIRPVLIENCYACHNSVNKRESNFALDHRAGIRAMIDFQAPENSRLLKVVRHEIKGVEMPSGGAKLAPKVISDLTRWIRMGAPDPRAHPPSEEQFDQERSWESALQRRKNWWCFQPIGNPAVPGLKDARWSAHPVDRFVWTRMQASGLSPSPEADRVTLIRRLSFALTGLPPTEVEIARFEADRSDGAYEELVDRLLNSNRFGERWARHWMDWIRYAESHGSEGDPVIPHAYRYRDYLIRAFNEDVPYDQLVREHIAGDLLAKPRLNTALGINESALGTAHWRMVFHGFAPTDAMDEKVRFTDDQINTFSKAFLGLTVSCARCHNHKFDAISQADYYALFGILGSTRPSMLDANTARRQSLHRVKLAEMKQELRGLLAQAWLAEIDKLRNELPALPGEWNRAIEAAKPPSHPLHWWWRVRRDVGGGNQFEGVWKAIVDQWSKDSEAIDVYKERAIRRRWSLGSGRDYDRWFASGNGLSDRPASAGDYSLHEQGSQIVRGIYPAGGYSHLISTKHRGIFSSPRIHLDDKYDLWVQVAGAGGASVRYAVQNYPRSGTVYPVTNLSGGDWNWQRFKMDYWTGDDIHIELATAADAPLLAQDNPRSWFGIREALLMPAGQPGPNTAGEQHSPLLKSALRTSPKTLDDLANLYLNTIRNAVIRWRDRNGSDSESLLLNSFLKAGLLPNRIEMIPEAELPLVEYRRLEQQIPQPTRIVGLGEADSFDQALLLRGNHKTPGDPVARRFLEAIDPTPYRSNQSGRLELAEDLLRSDNPLPARVIVNRVWHHLFGRGIVATTDNFGRLGSKPTHPELLDYLARRFMTEGWSIKEMIGFVVKSKTWRQSSTATAESRAVDPANKLLSHSNLRRLEAESIRDSLLAVSGRLDATMYGPSVRGEIPRRSIYLQVRRNALDPFLRVFDFPEPYSATGRRNVTNVPAQSLTMMNDKFVNALSRDWARRVLDTGTPNDGRRIRKMFRQALGRKPSTVEQAAALRYLQELRQSTESLARQVAKLKAESARQSKIISEIKQPVRERLLAEQKKTKKRPDLKPISRWEFDGDLRDSVGQTHGKAVSGAKVEAGALVVDGRSYVVTQPIAEDLLTKSLEVWVQLDNLDQRGGGVMTVQTPDGIVFDSVVFGEQQPRQWLAGSNNFRRTRPFAGDPETSADKTTVHLVIAYHSDGRIVGYRNGAPYGKGYKSNGPRRFYAGKTTVAFGVRHLPPGGNRMLSGRILRAQLYDRALSSEEVAVSASGSGPFVSETQLLAALTEKQRTQLTLAESSRDKLRQQLAAFGRIPDSSPEALWSDLARALFNLKEFIYIR